MILSTQTHIGKASNALAKNDKIFQVIVIAQYDVTDSKLKLELFSNK